MMADLTGSIYQKVDTTKVTIINGNGQISLLSYILGRPSLHTQLDVKAFSLLLFSSPTRKELGGGKGRSGVEERRR